MFALRQILRAIDLINAWVAKTISWVVIVIIVTTIYEIIQRYIFNAPTDWVFEFNYLIHGPYFLLLGAYTFAINGHVNVDIIYARLSKRAKAVVDVFTMPLFFFFTLMMLIYGGRFAMNSLAFRETMSSAWAPPVYPVKFAIPVAAFLMLLQGLAKFVRDLHLAVTGKEGAL